MTGFREDGAAALEWAASYLERVRELPVLAQVEPGEIRRALPDSPPEVGESFSAVLRDLDDGSSGCGPAGLPRPGRALLGARALLGREGSAPARTGGPEGAGRQRVPDAY